jgi:hypothetical protein
MLRGGEKRIWGSEIQLNQFIVPDQKCKAAMISEIAQLTRGMEAYSQHNSRQSNCD